jgi:hypothetical protein
MVDERVDAVARQQLAALDMADAGALATTPVCRGESFVEICHQAAVLVGMVCEAVRSRIRG